MTKFFILLGVLLSINFAFGQEKNEPQIETINGKKFYIHKVEHGHTLYAISKKYLIEIEDILEENPDLKEGLKIDQIVKVPVVKQNKKLEKINTPEIRADHMLHTVEQGQTLYSLSKQYNIDLAALVDANPGIENSMKAGQQITVPVEKVKDLKPVAAEQAVNDGLVRHIVKKGETLYSLAKTYGVMADSITIINNGLPGGLRLDESIIIPRNDPSRPKLVKTVKADSISNFIKRKFRKEQGKPDSSSAIYESYNVALFLPFYLNENDLLKHYKKEFEKESMYPNSLAAVSFYEGFLMALDSLKKEGLSVKLFVYDTGNDSNALKSLVLKSELKEMDLMIGPLYSTSFALLADYARKNQVHIVSPFANNLSLIKGNPFASKPTSDPSTRIKKMVAYISQEFAKDNIVIVNSGSEHDKELLNFCVSSCKILMDTNAFKSVAYKTAKIEGVKKNLVFGKNNVIIVPSGDQAFVTDLITRINYWTKDYKITLVGVDSWMEFDNLDLEYLLNLRTHFAVANTVDYDSVETKSFMRQYRSRNYVDPDFFALQGFDVGFFYLRALMSKGADLNSTLPGIQYSGIQSIFDFSRLNPSSGFENNGISIMKYENYKFIKVN